MNMAGLIARDWQAEIFVAERAGGRRHYRLFAVGTRAQERSRAREMLAANGYKIVKRWFFWYAVLA